jgi:hypothetical protein
MAMLDLGEQVKTAPARHREIEDDRVEWIGKRGERLIAVVSLGHGDAREVVLEDRTNPAAYYDMVVDEQDPVHAVLF